MEATVDARLHSWPQLDEAPWRVLLVGNGFSTGIAPQFTYPSLYEQALRRARLTQEARLLFGIFATSNFERVLAALWEARTVCHALRMQTEEARLAQLYEGIKQALIDTVHEVHVAWSTVETRLPRIRRALRAYQWVFTTNYDLLVYWAVNYEGQSEGFKDYLWYNRFSIADVDIDEDAVRLLYMHGGLHLYTTPDGETRKLQASDTQNILTQFQATGMAGAIPLFVSEGTAAEKQRAIRRHDYLTFAFREFAERGEPTVVFGHSLSPHDQHIVEVLRLRPERRIAVSVLRGKATDIQAFKLHAYNALQRTDNIWFFDAATHPLGQLG